MKREIMVNLGKRSYPIIIQNGLLKECAPYFLRMKAVRKTAMLTTAAIYKACGKRFLASIKKAGIQPRLIFIGDGEKQKTEHSLFYILRIMAKEGFQRDSRLISLGGGVVGDLGGLAASLYMRGIAFVQCPTTLLAQVDASVGGKTAIDFAGVKNLIGTFYQPKFVLIDPEALQTLNERQFKTGLAEVVKYGIIRDESIFKDFESHAEKILKRESSVLFRLIFKSCKIKAKIVSEDEREGGKRAWLNYGHTLGHALEAYFDYQTLTHGEAIAYGMWFASLISLRLGLCTNDVLDRQVAVLKKIGLFRKLPPFRPQEVYKKMFLDKKSRGGQIQFILTRKIGLVTIQKNISRPVIFSALAQLQAEASKRN